MILFELEKFDRVELSFIFSKDTLEFINPSYFSVDVEIKWTSLVSYTNDTIMLGNSGLYSIIPALTVPLTILRLLVSLCYSWYYFNR